MKHKLLLLVSFAVLSSIAHGQTSDADKISMFSGKIFSSRKSDSNSQKLAIAQITINYKLTSTAKTIGKDKKSNSVAGAKLSAYLEITDGELTTADFQEISDSFYNSFQSKLQANNIQTVDWSAITATDFYKSEEEKEEKKVSRDENVWVTNNANKGNVLYGGGTAFAFGKMKRASKFCEEIGAMAGFFYLTVDFADLLLDLQMSSGTSSGMYYSTTTKNKKYTWAVNPVVTVESPQKALGQISTCLFWNEKMQSDSSFLFAPILGTTKYASNVTEDSSKLKNSLWAFRKEMQPVVVETTKEKYKAAAKEALDRYADAFIAKVLSLKSK
jgi:hypothetical protein